MADADSAMQEPSSWRRSGNEVSMKKIVDLHYSKVLQDSRLAPFFQGIDMKALKRQQEKLMALVFGGMDLIEDESPEFDLRAIHMRLLVEGGLGLQQWGQFVEHFEHTLAGLEELPDEIKKSAMDWLRTTEPAFRPAEPHEIEAFRSQKAEGKGPAACPFSGAS